MTRNEITQEIQELTEETDPELFQYQGRGGENPPLQQRRRELRAQFEGGAIGATVDHEPFQHLASLLGR
jgi:hypothetical protein